MKNKRKGGLFVMILSCLLTISLTTSCDKKYVTYEEYGAVGDGVHDDQMAIIAAHDAANELGLPVRAKDGKTYYIGKSDKVAVIQTDVDFGKAKFIINDVETDTRRGWYYFCENHQRRE